MPQRIADWCRQTGQSVPDGPAAMVRCVLESLALAYRQTIELLTAACGISPPAVHIVGGGARNELLCQLTADATGLPVWAGPTEASEVGNLLVQAMALGELSSLEDARAVVAESFSPVLYEPRQRGPWDDAYQRFGRLGRPGRGGPGT
jgi:rhamnulokinase